MTGLNETVNFQSDAKSSGATTFFSMPAFSLSLLSICCLTLSVGLGTDAVAQDQAVPIFSAPEPTAVTTTASELEILTVPMTADELSDLATTWQEHIKGVLQEIALLNLELEVENEARDAVLRDQLAAALERQREVQDGYSAVIEAWRTKGAAAEETQVHGTYINALRLEAVRTTDPRTLWQLSVNWLTSAEGGLGFLLKIAGFFVALWVMYYVARLLRRARRRAATSARRRGRSRPG